MNIEDHFRIVQLEANKYAVEQKIGDVWQNRGIIASQALEEVIEEAILIDAIAVMESLWNEHLRASVPQEGRAVSSGNVVSWEKINQLKKNMHQPPLKEKEMTGEDGEVFFSFLKELEDYIKLLRKSLLN